MSEEIKVGEYVRTNDGYIGKIREKYPNGIELAIHYKATHNLNDIVKHSENIIDLIESGDYVNGIKVKNTFIDPFTKKRRLEIEGIEVNWQGDKSSIYIESEDIKSIVTKEQFKEMEYKL